MQRTVTGLPVSEPSHQLPLPTSEFGKRLRKVLKPKAEITDSDYSAIEKKIQASLGKEEANILTYYKR